MVVVGWAFVARVRFPVQFWGIPFWMPLSLPLGYPCYENVYIMMSVVASASLFLGSTMLLKEELASIWLDTDSLAFQGIPPDCVAAPEGNS